MTTLYFVRHAQSVMNAEFPHLIGGRTNHSPLTPTGIDQARAFGRRLQRQNLCFDRWFMSPAVRTMHTAKLAAEACGYTGEIAQDDRLQEVHQGEWEGLVRADKYTADIMQQIEQKKGYFKAPGGESQFDVEHRMMAFADECHAKFAGEAIVVFSHGVAIKCLLRGVQNWDPGSTYHTDLDNTGVSVIHFHPDHKRWRLRWHNDHAHLRHPSLFQ